MYENVVTPSFFQENTADIIREHRLQYLVVNAVSRRVRQLQLGERALALPADGNRDPVHIAIAEFMEDKLEITPKQIVPQFSQPEEQHLDVAADYDTHLGLDDGFADEEI